MILTRLFGKKLEKSLKKFYYDFERSPILASVLSAHGIIRFCRDIGELDENLE
jgi:hypothetical protein